LVCVDVDILGGSVHTAKENAETLLVTSKKIGLEMNADKTKYMRKEHRLRVFKNRVLRRIFGFKRDKGTEEWRKLHSNSKAFSPFTYSL
jgi:hypothetical protein